MSYNLRKLESTVTLLITISQILPLFNYLMWVFNFPACAIWTQNLNWILSRALRRIDFPLNTIKYSFMTRTFFPLQTTWVQRNDTFSSLILESCLGSEISVLLVFHAAHLPVEAKCLNYYTIAHMSSNLFSWWKASLNEPLGQPLIKLELRSLFLTCSPSFCSVMEIRMLLLLVPLNQCGLAQVNNGARSGLV